MFTNIVMNIKNKLKYPEDMTVMDKLPEEQKVDSQESRINYLRSLVRPTEHDE